MSSLLKKWDPRTQMMRGRGYLWLRDLKLRLENFHTQYVSKRAGGLRWYKAELVAERSQVHRLELELESAKESIAKLAKEDPGQPLVEAERLLRMVEEIVVSPALKGEAIQNYELRCWRDDYMQFKIHVIGARPESERDLLVSSTNGTIKVYRTKK